MKDSSYYNDIYEISDKYNQPYDNIIYYPIYKKIIDKLNVHDIILELGCGVGHLAQMIEDNGCLSYLGIDFSEIAIEKAKKRSYQSFICSDIVNDNLDFPYDLIIATEFFEHVEYEKILKKIKKGTRIIFSVPNFLIDSHLYCWEDDNHIRNDFREYMLINTVETVLEIKGKKWFLVDGFKK
jgi:2-polyprenyl-3-methyl-5-hydroxy-6-metoxy-1,4-benzoquinol methylase